MSESVIPYDKDLPFNPNRGPSIEPDSYLVKKGGGYAVVQGRRPSKLLLVDKIRVAVKKWRLSNYEGATETTKELFSFWFEEDHETEGKPFQYYFAQREAIETIAYLVEIERFADVVPLIKKYATLAQESLLADDMFQETPDRKRSIRRYFPELKQVGTQDLPEASLVRYAVKMATGSGKTVVMALLMVWSYFNRLREGKTNLADNFLLVAPNVIVLERLERDLLDGSIFRDLPMIPPYMRGQWNLKVITRGDSGIPNPSGNLFLQNIQQLYESRDIDRWTPENAVQALLGRPAQKAVEKTALSVLHHLKNLDNLIVMNDEAHHVHEEELAWYKTLATLNRTIPGGLKLWLDFSATPKDQNGTFFSWIIVDYPLAEAVEDSIVKAPVILHTVKKKDPENVTQDNVTSVYRPWITTAYERWKEHSAHYAKLGKKPVLFIMCEKNAFADELAKVVRGLPGVREEEVLTIHTDSTGEVRKGDLEDLRIKARDIDQPKNKIKVVVSVLMLREGWDVQNVTISLGLRPFTAKAKILPEQAIGRGLRLMSGVSTDTRQTLEVIGTEAFEDIVKELEQEGVGISTFTTPPPLPIHIEPIKSRLAFDIEIPQTELLYSRDYRQLSEVDPLKIPSLKSSQLLTDPQKLIVTMEFATTKTYLGTVQITPTFTPTAAEFLSHITSEAIKRAKLVGSDFAAVYPIVRRYVSEVCFEKKVDPDEEAVRARLADPDVESAVITVIAKALGTASVVKNPVKLKQEGVVLSKTPTFVWRRPHIEAKHTIFNFVACYNDFEAKFAEFLDHARDIEKFASLAERNVGFKIDYLSSKGAIRFYYPDFVAVQKMRNKVVNWIIETKGRFWEDTDKKEAAVRNWCTEVSKITGQEWRYALIPQEIFEKHDYYDFAELLKRLA
jgi:type III restriction enzyme